MTIKPGDRVSHIHKFAPPGKVVATWGPWAWVMWDEYPTGHEPSTHSAASLRLHTPDSHPCAPEGHETAPNEGQAVPLKDDEGNVIGIARVFEGGRVEFVLEDES